MLHVNKFLNTDLTILLLSPVVLWYHFPNFQISQRLAQRWPFVVVLSFEILFATGPEIEKSVITYTSEVVTVKRASGLEVKVDVITFHCDLFLKKWLRKSGQIVRRTEREIHTLFIKYAVSPGPPVLACNIKAREKPRATPQAEDWRS